MDCIQQKANKCPQAENTYLQRQLNLIRFPNQSTFYLIKHIIPDIQDFIKKM